MYKSRVLSILALTQLFKADPLTLFWAQAIVVSGRGLTEPTFRPKKGQPEDQCLLIFEALNYQPSPRPTCSAMSGYDRFNLHVD